MDLTCALTLTQGEDKIGLFQVLTVSGVSLMFRRIPAGAFLMGSPTDEPSRFADEEQREESVAAFWMADTPVTQALYRAVSGECPSHSQGGDLPVEMVSWEDALAFIDKLGRLVPGLNLRLPSEVEWEYACRAGATSAYSFGTTVSPSQANFRSGRDGRRGVAEVKAYRANAWGPTPDAWERVGVVLGPWCSVPHAARRFVELCFVELAVCCARALAIQP